MFQLIVGCLLLTFTKIIANMGQSCQGRPSIWVVASALLTPPSHFG